MNPAAAAITLTGHAPLVIAPLYPATGSVEVTGVAPTIAAGADVFVFPAAAASSLSIIGLAPASFVYNEASIGLTRVTLRPALEGRVRINRG